MALSLRPRAAWRVETLEFGSPRAMRSGFGAKVFSDDDSRSSRMTHAGVNLRRTGAVSTPSAFSTKRYFGALEPPFLNSRPLDAVVLPKCASHNDSDHVLSPRKEPSSRCHSFDNGSLKLRLVFPHSVPSSPQPASRFKTCFSKANSGSPSEASSESESPEIQNPSSIPEAIPRWTALTPLRWAILLVLVLGAFKAVYNFIQNVLLHPKFLMYSSWFFVLWPFPAAIALGIFGLIIAIRQKTNKNSQLKQFILLATAIVWLILVPLGLFQGYVDGWPIFLSIFYFLFFSASAFIRYKLYGDLAPKEQDEQWKTPISKFAQVAFVLTVVGCHWYAAKEALWMERNISLTNNIARILLFFAFWLHYVSFAFLGKYFDRLVIPKTVVMFGPYRFVRHPIYTSYMLLFAGYCVALRSYVSMVILLVACLAYYHQRTELEEKLLSQNFPNLYPDYKQKVTKKFFPFLI